MDATIVTLKFFKDGTITANIPEAKYINYVTIRQAVAVLNREFALKLEEGGRHHFKPVSTPEIEDYNTAKLEALKTLEKSNADA